jgi:pyruvate dehydrogenase E2 component (dihydrolipoamide acetyltransferase)
MTMEEGILVRWIAPDGASVRQGESLFEIETEKVSMEVEATDEGVLKHLVPAGATLAPGAIVGCLLAAGEGAVPPEILEQVRVQGGATAGSGATSEPEPASPAGTALANAPGSRAVASPSARRLARERGVDLATVVGGGPGGRIVERDILEAAERMSAAAPASAAEQRAPSTSAGESEPYSGRRRTIGERMHQSLQTMAQLTLSGEAPIDAALEMIHGLNREWRTERLVVTLSALVVRAAALALREHPKLNARLDGERIVLEPRVNIGLAIDHPAGLMVPVVRDADSASLKEVARTIGALADRVRDGSIGVDEMTGGTFAVTSLEGFAVDAFSPVINPPQAAILGVGRVRDVPLFSGDAVRRGQATTLSLTFDHRVLDGAPAARFLTRVTELLDRPYLLM